MPASPTSSDSEAPEPRRGRLTLRSREDSPAPQTPAEAPSLPPAPAESSPAAQPPPPAARPAPVIMVSAEEFGTGEEDDEDFADESLEELQALEEATWEAASHVYDARMEQPDESPDYIPEPEAPTGPAPKVGPLLGPQRKRAPKAALVLAPLAAAGIAAGLWFFYMNPGATAPTVEPTTQSPPAKTALAVAKLTPTAAPATARARVPAALEPWHPRVILDTDATPFLVLDHVAYPEGSLLDDASGLRLAELDPATQQIILVDASGETFLLNY